MAEGAYFQPLKMTTQKDMGGMFPVGIMRANRSDKKAQLYFSNLKISTSISFWLPIIFSLPMIGL
jgi:hypothetical protein